MLSWRSGGPASLNLVAQLVGLPERGVESTTARRAATTSSPTRRSRSASSAGCGRFSISPRRWFSASTSSLGGRVVQQVVPQIVALHHPDVAQHFIQHAGRPAGATPLRSWSNRSQAEEPSKRITISSVGERGVVVRNSRRRAARQPASARQPTRSNITLVRACYVLYCSRKPGRKARQRGARRAAVRVPSAACNKVAGPGSGFS